MIPGMMRDAIRSINPLGRLAHSPLTRLQGILMFSLKRKRFIKCTHKSTLLGSGILFKILWFNERRQATVFRFSCVVTEPNSLPIFSTMDASRGGEMSECVADVEEKETNVTGATQHKVPRLRLGCQNVKVSKRPITL